MLLVMFLVVIPVRDEVVLRFSAGFGLVPEIKLVLAAVLVVILLL